MNKMKKQWKIAAIVTVAVALIVGGGSLVMAQTTETTVPPVGACGGPGLGMLGSDATAVTGLLGLTADELRTLRAEGKSLVEIAAAKGVSEDALVAAVLKAHQDAVSAAVTAGRITKAQADLMLKDAEARIRLMVESKGVGPFGIGPRSGGCRGAIDSDVVAPGAGFGGLRGFRGGCR
jgi:hypothetical protein